MPWAKFPLPLTTTIQFTFFNFVTALESSLFVHHQHARRFSTTHYAQSTPFYLVCPDDHRQQPQIYDQQDMSEHEDTGPIDRRTNLYASDPRQVRKSDFDRPRTRKTVPYLALAPGFAEVQDSRAMIIAIAIQAHPQESLR